MDMPISQPRTGHIVALEGPSDLVSTQLRLLPTSSRILILPSLQHYLRDKSPEAPFNARKLIHRYREAVQTRHAEALEFLRPSRSTGEERLVFMHGGVMSAQILCLSSIMEHETDGNIEKAHATFIRLANNGLARLSLASLSCHDGAEKPLSDKPKPEGFPEQAASNEVREQRTSPWKAHSKIRAHSIEDPIIRAMKAADALDKETEFLQPPTPDVNLTVKLIDIPPSKKRLSPTVVDAPENPRGSRPPPPREHQAKLSPEPVPGVSPNSALSHQTASAASTASQKPSLRIHIPSSPITWASDVAVGGAQPKVHHPQGPVPGVLSHKRSQTGESKLSSKQKPIIDGSNREQPVAVESGNNRLARSEEGNPEQLVSSQLTETRGQPSESLLPLLEDLVIFFNPETPDRLHDFVFQRLSEGYQTSRQSICGAQVSQPNNFPNTSSVEMEDELVMGQLQSEKEGFGDITTQLRKDLVHGLPTPNHSPSPLCGSPVAVPRRDTKLYSISVGQETAVSIQNFLRSFLGSQFPVRDRHISTVDGLEVSAEPALWNPLECDTQFAASSGERRLDLILAIGSESGVSKSRLSEVVGQIEKLSFKTSGLSRSGRLDIRYLIANTMQAFTAQPLTKQVQSNPFADRALLAALIIPHLETYLATHPDVRFLLLEYPSEHLPTVLALQTLMGMEVMKVVGIVNSDVSTPGQKSSSLPDTNRWPSEGFRSIDRRGSRTSDAFFGPCSFSKANFVLASSATGNETAAFVAAIRESLISVSDYYMPERPLFEQPAPQSPQRKTHSGLTVKTKSPSKKSPVQKEEITSRFSLTTLITPPSSPTESSSPPPTHSPQHIKPRGIHPRSSSLTAASTPCKAPRACTSCTDTSTIRDPVQWAEVNYTTDSQVPSAPATTAVKFEKSKAGSSGRTSARTNKSPRQRHHRKQDSVPLSPRAVPPSYKAFTSTSSSPSTLIPKKPAAVVATTLACDEKEEDYSSDSDSELAREARRLMPLYLRRREEIERGRSSKAMRWLGL
ncbi:hypothetical protein C7999DRAFT_41522 [Corynascus novoguineensis]|uniref:Uncharacterized protein n=1 Tax=Corynascus novoguineensis TaxID=1126955 RepID=A0AAN7CSK6_9PEZI|nr:hypothetical protein C7999DRAFT_41522 [Corynascus novoguineensis]